MTAKNSTYYQAPTFLPMKQPSKICSLVELLTIHGHTKATSCDDDRCKESNLKEFKATGPEHWTLCSYLESRMIFDGDLRLH